MFEDATFESTGRIHTRSRGWMIATFLFNGTIVLTLILIPLVYPEALPRQALSFLLTTPPPPTAPPQLKEPPQPFRGTSDMLDHVILAPSTILRGFTKNATPEAAPTDPLFSMDQGSGIPDAATGVFAGHRTAVVVHPDAKGPVRVPSTIVAGLLIAKNLPAYPPIAKAAGVEGTVVLQATISKTGTIENLRVVSGPAMLQQSALDAVKTWRYRPYLLDGLPLEVETTVNVVFRMER
jgi:protein TonB